LRRICGDSGSCSLAAGISSEDLSQRSLQAQSDERVIILQCPLMG
jgi:hypothetical protein